MRRSMTTIAAALLFAGTTWTLATAAPADKNHPNGGNNGPTCQWPKITAQGHPATFGAAMNAAKASWSAAVLKADGAPFADWNNSTQRNLSCLPTGPTLLHRYVCTATALPCK